MSAFYAVAYEDRVELLTDGAVYSNDGTVEMMDEKVWRSKTLPAAFTGRGNHLAVKILGTTLSMLSARAQTFDALFLEFKEVVEKQKGRDNAPAMDGLLVGVSETLGPVMYYFHTWPNADEMNGMEPWTLYDAGKEILHASTPDQRALRDSGLPMFFSLDGLLEHGVAFFNVLRAHKMQHWAAPGRPEVYAIGGHLDWTVVAANGAETMRIWEWPDVIGEPIDPAREGREAVWAEAIAA